MQVTKTVLIYGKTKVGKTLDVGYTFGKNAFFILSEPDGLSSIEANLGFLPDHEELVNVNNPYAEVVALLNKRILPDIKKGKIKAVVLDTGSEFADRLLAVELIAAGNDGRRAYPQVYWKFTGIMRTILLSGAWFVMICHQKIADQDNDRMGGPLLPGRLVESIPSQFSLILRATVEDTPAGRQRIYHCDPLDPDFIMGDRYGVAFDKQPMELKALMWRIANPGGDTPGELLLGKPIRMGGKIYQPGMLPKKAVDPLAGLDIDTSPVESAEAVVAMDVAPIEEKPAVVAVAASAAGDILS